MESANWTQAVAEAEAALNASLDLSLDVDLDTRDLSAQLGQLLHAAKVGEKEKEVVHGEKAAVQQEAHMAHGQDVLSRSHSLSHRSLLPPVTMSSDLLDVENFDGDAAPQEQMHPSALHGSTRTRTPATDEDERDVYVSMDMTFDLGIETSAEELIRSANAHEDAVEMNAHVNTIDNQVMQDDEEERRLVEQVYADLSFLDRSMIINNDNDVGMHAAISITPKTPAASHHPDIRVNSATGVHASTLVEQTPHNADQKALLSFAESAAPSSELMDDRDLETREKFAARNVHRQLLTGDETATAATVSQELVEVHRKLDQLSEAQRLIEKDLSVNAAAANVQDKLQILSAQMRALQAQVCDLILAQKTPQENVQHSASDLHAVVRELLTEERAILRRDIEKHVTAAVNRTSSSPSGSPSTVAASIFEEHVMPKLDAWLRETEYKITDRVSRNLRYEIDFILRTREKERLLRGDDEVMGAKPGLIVATDMPAPSSSTHRTSIAVDGPSRATATPSHKVEGISWQDDADLKKSNLQFHRELNEFKSRLDSRAHDLAGMRRSKSEFIYPFDKTTSTTITRPPSSAPSSASLSRRVPGYQRPTAASAVRSTARK